MQDSFVRDIRYTVRGLAKSPAFAATVILTLALGIGFNTAIFSIADRLLLRPMPFPNGEQVVMLHENRSTSSRMDVSPANWLDWQRDSESFEAFAAWTNRVPVTLSGDGEAERLDADNVSHEFFPLLGVAPALGRAFAAEDDQVGAPPRVILSHSLWQRRFGADRSIVGRVIQLNDVPTEVIGVMPPGFQFMSQETELWRPFGLDRARDWRGAGGRFIPFVVGRLKPSVTVEAAQAEMTAIAARLAELHAFNKNSSVNVIPLREVMSGQVRTSVLLLFAAVGVLLLIACSNIASLLLARAARRRRELAIRTSLGAGRAAIVQQLLIESIVLALAGGAAALLVARWSAEVLLSLAPPDLLPISDVSLDQRVLLYAFGLALLTGILVGLVPSIAAAREQPALSLREGSRSVTTSARLRQGLIVAQVAMTVVLLCGAGLLVRSLSALTADPTGVAAANVVTFRVDLPVSRYEPAQQVAFFRQATENLRSLPGVQAVSAARDIPMSLARISGTSVRIQGEPELPPGERLTTLVRVVTPGYFETLRIPIVQGREFTDADQTTSAAPGFVVNEAFARKHLATTDPLSASLSVNMQENNPYGAIIGVAGNVKDGSLRGTPEPTVFYSNSQLDSPGMTLLVRSERGSALAQEAVQIIRRMDPNLPVTQLRMLENAFADSVARDKLNAVVAGAFGISALLLASLGLYGLLGYTVAERTNEIGVRMALGARAAGVLRMIMVHGCRLVAFGAVLGLAGTFLLARVLESLLFGVTSRDPVTFVGVAALLFAVSMLAVLIPALRATRVDPLVALRNE
jgi:putative ABC transport system permease protein